MTAFDRFEKLWLGRNLFYTLCVATYLPTLPLLSPSVSQRHLNLSALNLAHMSCQARASMSETIATHSLTQTLALTHTPSLKH